MGFPPQGFGGKATEISADVWTYPTRVITGGAPTATEEGSGTLTADGTEQEIVSKTSTEPFMAQLILDVSNMAGADQILIEETVKVLPAGGLEKFTRTRITGAQEEPILMFVQKYAVRQYRVTLQQLAGTLRTFDWSLIVEE